MDPEATPMAAPAGGSRPRRVARSAFGAAGLLSLAACGFWITNLKIRPPCYPGYVRLIDLPAVLPEVAGVITLLSGAMFLIDRKRPSRRRGIPRTIFAIVLLVLALLLVIGGIGAVATDQGPYDNSCWTF